jgi:short subunit dehydrogenase-like uncharacterized protein
MLLLLIYGASGYIGRIASYYVKSLRLKFIVARRAGSTKIKDLALKLSIQYRLFNVTEPAHTNTALEGISVLLNYASPFMLTAELLIAACIQKGVHYLNIAAELDSYKLAEKNNYKAREANIILLPGYRGSVVILEYLASKVIKEVKNPASINISLCISSPISRRLAISTSKNMSAESLQHINRELVKRETTDIIQLNFDNG